MAIKTLLPPGIKDVFGKIPELYDPYYGSALYEKIYESDYSTYQDRRDQGYYGGVIPQIPVGASGGTQYLGGRPLPSVPKMVPVLTKKRYPPLLKGAVPIVGGAPTPVQETRTPTIATAKPKDKTMDLGDLIKDLATTYVSAKYGQPNIAAPQGTYPLNYPGGLSGLQTAVAAGEPRIQTAGLDLPFLDVIKDREGEKGYVYDPNANCGEGKWIKKRRRRHRKLATRGDLSQLAALKGILGTGKAFEVWIATHS